MNFVEQKTEDIDTSEDVVRRSSAETVLKWTTSSPSTSCPKEPIAGISLYITFTLFIKYPRAGQQIRLYRLYNIVVVVVLVFGVNIGIQRYTLDSRTGDVHVKCRAGKNLGFLDFFLGF